jgi:hypothetical protein
MTAQASPNPAAVRDVIAERRPPADRVLAVLPASDLVTAAAEAVAPVPQPQRGLLPAASAAGYGHFQVPAVRAVFCAPGFPLPDAATGSELFRRGPRGGGEP